MSGGNNRKFIADPAGFAKSRVILVPDDGSGFWSSGQQGPFDLSEAAGSGFEGTVLVLSHMSRRGKAASDTTRPIAGEWVSYEPGKLMTKNITAVGSSYFVFTSKLGGCALGIKDATNPNTVFTHDASNAQEKNLAGAAVTLLPESYDPKDEGKNITGFFWWNGQKWQAGQSASYNAFGLTQTIGMDKYPKKMGAL